jgi:hypothetical protein
MNSVSRRCPKDFGEKVAELDLAADADAVVRKLTTYPPEVRLAVGVLACHDLVEGDAGHGMGPGAGHERSSVRRREQQLLGEDERLESGRLGCAHGGADEE